MSRTATVFLALGLALSGWGGAVARPHKILNSLTANTQYPGAPHPVVDTTPPPYPMNYADEAAQALGVHQGRVSVFTVKSQDDGLTPTLSGGIDGSGAMLKLQWHPGE
jgi:hypothetical protein